nr:hypothetical protein [uncultured Sphingomonas sp.]
MSLFGNPSIAACPHSVCAILLGPVRRSAIVAAQVQHDRRRVPIGLHCRDQPGQRLAGVGLRIAVERRHRIPACPVGQRPRFEYARFGLSIAPGAFPEAVGIDRLPFERDRALTAVDAEGAACERRHCNIMLVEEERSAPALTRRFELPAAPHPPDPIGRQLLRRATVATDKLRSDRHRRVVRARMDAHLSLRVVIGEEAGPAIFARRVPEDADGHMAIVERGDIFPQRQIIVGIGPRGPRALQRHRQLRIVALGKARILRIDGARVIGGYFVVQRPCIRPQRSRPIALGRPLRQGRRRECHSNSKPDPPHAHSPPSRCATIELRASPIGAPPGERIGELDRRRRES